MEAIKQEKLLSRSKSTGFLDKLDCGYDFESFSTRFCGYSGWNASVSSIDGSDLSAEETKLDSRIRNSADNETLFILEQKVDKLNELLQEQHNLLMSIKEIVIGSKAQSERQLAATHINKSDKGFEDNRETMGSNETVKLDVNGGPQHGEDTSAATSQLHAILAHQDRQGIDLDHMIRVSLENFLRRDELRERIAAATAECMQGVIRGSFSRVISNAYLPMVECSHRRLVKHVTRLLDNSFVELEQSTASLFKNIHKTSRNIRASLERHQNLLEAVQPVRNIKALCTTLKGVLEEELKSWREKVLEELTSRVLCDDSAESDSQEALFADYSPSSPMQPANPETSVIDSLMRCAVINKHVQDGDLNGAFEEALSSADLSLVMAACRAAPGAATLRPPVLLSLLQQLATDMVHDTHLKCRYLEEAITSLDKWDAATREHLPLVVGEVHKHLTKFLLSYPKHHASRRVALIVMAADNLLK